MANREENIPSDPSNEGGSDDQPRDLQELLLWHQELSSRPSRESNNPRKTTKAMEALPNGNGRPEELAKVERADPKLRYPHY